MFVATATCASTPNEIKAGTVIRDVLPVTTLTLLVKKKMMARMNSLMSGTRHLIKAVPHLKRMRNRQVARTGHFTHCALASEKEVQQVDCEASENAPTI
jgi:hypothetical protein